MFIQGGILALLASLYFSRRYLSWAILWTPVPFYVLCIAWGSVPIYHPEWWPFSYYNVRYGLQLLPAIAVFAALACQFAANFVAPTLCAWCVALMISEVILPCGRKRRSACARPGQRRGAHGAGTGAGAELKSLPQSATVMMDCGAHSGALQMAGSLSGGS